VSLPDGTRLLHIGPHKTGTTTIQAAFHDSRAALTDLGVHYAGSTAHPMLAAMGASGGTLPTIERSEAEGRWHDLVAEVTRSQARITVVSSEFFSSAPADRIRPILEALDADRTQVVVTLRPLCRILPSQWQQYMQNRPGLTYDDALDYSGWLGAILNRPEDNSITPSFWRRHRHDRLVRNWVAATGPDRVTVVVVDESEKRMLLRSFEQLIGVPEFTLEASTLSANRSLTFSEIEMLRAFNQRYLAQGWGTADYTRFVRFGAVRHLQLRRPGRDEPRLLTPEWAVQRAVEIGADMVESIRATGVKVVGDLDQLRDPSLARDVGDNPTSVPTPHDVVAWFVAGLFAEAGKVPPRAPRSTRNVGEIEAAVRLAQIEQRIAARTAELRSLDTSGPSGRALLRELGARAWRAAHLRKRKDVTGRRTP
jgi:hypothetical protein